MASGTGDQRLLTRSAKAASAGGILLALVVAALAFPGCGGGSSDATSSAATETASTPNDEASTGSQAAPGATADTPSSKGATGAGGSATRGERPSSGSRHGPSVPVPTGEPEPGITPKQRREATVASMLLESPSLPPSAGGTQALSPRYTCDGRNISPALRWQGVPQGTKELALLVMNLQPVEEKLFFDWAVAGLSPDLDEIEAGQLPRGAVVGRNGFGKAAYGICPKGDETYMFALFALPEKLSPAQGFEPLAFRKAVLDASGNAGILALSYSRG